MSKYYYRKLKNKNFRNILRFLSLTLSFAGILITIYTLSPLFLWQIYFASTFASQNVKAPIPKETIVNTVSLRTLIENTYVNLKGKDYGNAQNWFPKQNWLPDSKTPIISSYTISIPKLNIKDAFVSTIDYDLNNHLVNYGGTAIPPNRGNAVIFGHSTIPVLFNPKDYKTIFATLHTISTGDEIIVNVSGILYTYKVYNITIVESNDTSVFSQIYNNQYLTLVTCTPPGTTWKRLIVKSRLESI